MYSDTANWPAQQRQYAIKPEIQAFVMKAMKTLPNG